MSVVPFSAFILGMDRECEVEDSAFSRKRGSRDGIFLSCQNSEGAGSAPEDIMQNPQSSTNENAERRSSRSSFPHSFRVGDDSSRNSSFAFHNPVSGRGPAHVRLADYTSAGRLTVFHLMGPVWIPSVRCTLREFNMRRRLRGMHFYPKGRDFRVAPFDCLFRYIRSSASERSCSMSESRFESPGTIPVLRERS